MSAVAAKPQAGGAMNPTAMAVGVVMLLIILALCWYVSPGAGLMALILLQWTAGTCVCHFLAHPELSWFHNCVVLIFAH